MRVAQYYLGVALLLGRGVRQDYAEAVKWFQKAAEQGYPDAETISAPCTPTA